MALPKGKGKKAGAKPATRKTIKSRTVVKSKPLAKTVRPRRRAMMQSTSHPTFSPLDSRLMPTTLLDGKAFPVACSLPVTEGIASNQRCALILSCTGESATAAAYVRLDSVVSKNVVHTFPTLALADDAGGPSSGRGMKLGVQLVNTTQALNRGGNVFIVPLDQRIVLPAAPSAMTVAQWNTVMDGWISHPAAYPTDAEYFRETKSAYVHPVDDIKYRSFQPWKGTEGVDEFWTHVAVWPGASPTHRPMSTLIVVFQAPPTTQAYTFTMDAHYYTRWPVTSVLGQSQRMIPVASSQAANNALVAANARNAHGCTAFAKTPMRNGSVLFS